MVNVKGSQANAATNSAATGVRLALLKWAAAIVVAVIWSSPLVAQTSVWKVSQGDDFVYLAGTVHLLRSTDYPLPAAFEQAYAESQRLFFETDLAQMSDVSLQRRMMEQMTYQDGRTLRTVLNEEAYQALTQFVQDANVPIPLAMMQTFKPGFLMSTLSVLEFQKMGFTPQGVDAYFFTRAMGDGKERGQLESLDEQIAMLAAMGEGKESEYILFSLKDFSELENSIERIISAWRAGNMEALEDEFINDMRQASEELYESLLVRRNNAWLPIIENMFNEDGVEYVLAGVAHMVGEHGLLALLQDRGYTIEQLQ